VPLPIGAALAEHWYRQLDKAEREILRELVDVYPNTLPLTVAAERAGYAPSSGGVRNAAGKLRTLMLVEGGNAGMRAAERLVG
jgi:predicted transcriptional regulator